MAAEVVKYSLPSLLGLHLRDAGLSGSGMILESYLTHVPVYFAGDVNTE